MVLALATQRLIEDAAHLLGQVMMCRTLLPNADLLIYSSLQREAIASSTIEGTIASPDELVRFQARSSTVRGDRVREVANYGHALEWGYQQLPSRPLAGSLILQLHECLLQGVRGQGVVGRYKTRQNWIGRHPNEPIDQAQFVPPPPEAIPTLMAGLESYINATDCGETRVLQCALTHYQFETIHPFEDGNGRVGRLLIVLQMIQLGLLNAPLIHPSVYFERRREDYYSTLQGVRERGEWEAWIQFFAEGMIQQCRETIAFTQTILSLRDHLQKRIEHIQRRATVSAVLSAFLEMPVLSVTKVARRAQVAYNSAQAAITDLRAIGVLEEITGRERGRAFACRPVLDAIFSSPGSAT